MPNEYFARIKPKSSNQAGVTPTSADLEYAEIAVNTEDGTLFTKNEAGVIVQISGGGSGGGAVESVNGQDGVVSLGVLDMDDVLAYDVITFNNTYRSVPSAGSGDISSSNNSNENFLYIDKTDKAGNPVDLSALMAEVAAVPGGSSTTDYPKIYNTNGAYGITFRYVTSITDEGTWYNLYISGDPVEGTGGRGWPLANCYSGCDPSANWTEFANGVDMVLGPLTPLNGTVLQWNAAEQVFKLVDLPSAPVDSVNGQTGAVSIGVEELANYVEIPDTLAWAEYNYIGTNWNDTPDGGFSPSGTAIYLDRTPVQGMSLDDQGFVPDSTASASGSIWISEDGGLTYREVTHTKSYYQSDNIQYTGLSEDTDSWTIPLRVALNNPATQTIPAAQYQVLAKGPGANWYAETVVREVNGQTAVVNLGIEELDDVAIIASTVYQWDTVASDGAFQSPGKYDIRNSGDRLMVNPVDSLGQDVTALWMATPNQSTTWYVSTGNNPFVATTVTQHYDVTNFLEIQGITPAITDDNAPLKIAFYPPETILSNGDLLAYNSATQKWNPVQPAASAPVDSVNGQVGEVELGIFDINQVDNNPGSQTPRYVWNTITFDANYPDDDDYDMSGEAVIRYNGGKLYLNGVDSNGIDAYDVASGFPDPGFNYQKTWVSGDGGLTYEEFEYVSINRRDFTGFEAIEIDIYGNIDLNSSNTTSLTLSFVEPIVIPPGVQANDVLQYDASAAAFVAGALDESIFDLNDCENTQVSTQFGYNATFADGGPPPAWDEFSSTGTCVVYSVPSQNFIFANPSSYGPNGNILNLGDVLPGPSPFDYQDIWIQFDNGSILETKAYFDIYTCNVGDFPNASGQGNPVAFQYYYFYQFSPDYPPLTAGQGIVFISFSPPGQKVILDGQILQYDTTSGVGNFVPKNLVFPVTEVNGQGIFYPVPGVAAGSSVVSLGIENMNDYSQPIPLAGGEYLAWDESNQTWYGKIGVDTVNGQDGDVNLGVTDLDDYAETSAAVAGQVLTWDGAAWTPADAPGGGSGSGAVDSVNGQTGVVIIDVENLGDYQTGAVATAGQALTFDGTVWSPSTIDLNDLGDVSYDGHTLSITGLDGIHFTSTDNPAGATSSITLSSLGLGVLQHLSTGGSSFFASADAAKGATILTSGSNGQLWVESNPAQPTGTNNTPMIALGSGRQGSDDAAEHGYYIGARLPSGLTESTEYTLPPADGASGEVLGTDGNGSLSWVAGGGGVSSVNGETGNVELGVFNLTDVTYSQNTNAQTLPFNTYSNDNTPEAGGWNVNSSFIYFAYVDSNGVNQKPNYELLASGDTVVLTDANGATYNVVIGSTIAVQDDHERLLFSATPNPNGLGISNGALTLYSPKFVAQDLPVTNGQVLAYNTLRSAFVPVDPAGDAVDSVNGQTGVVNLGLNDLDGVNTNQGYPAWYTSLEDGDPLPVAPVGLTGDYVLGGSFTTAQAHSGTRSWLSTKMYAGGYYFPEVWVADPSVVGIADTKRYDCVSVWVYSTEELNTTYRASLGGTKTELAAGPGWTVYTRDTGFSLYGNGTYEEVGTKPTLPANQWINFSYIIDWGNGRTSRPNFSLWVDGAIAVNNVIPTANFIAFDNDADGNDAAKRFVLAHSQGGDNFDHYYDDFSAAQFNTAPVSMTDSTIDVAAFEAALQTQTYVTPIGSPLIFNGTEWVPGTESAINIGLGDINEVTFDSTSNGSGKSLVIADLDEMIYSSLDAVAGSSNKVYLNPTYGMSMASYDGEDGSYINLHKGKGIQLRVPDAIPFVYITNSAGTGSTPATFAILDGVFGGTNKYVGLTIPSGLTESTTYTLPPADGESGYVLTTNGLGQLDWVESSGGGGGGALPLVLGWTSETSGETNLSLTIDVPSGTIPDCTLVATITTRSDITVPDGWTLEGVYLNGGLNAGQRINVLTKTAALVEADSYTFEQASETVICGQMFAIKDGELDIVTTALGDEGSSGDDNDVTITSLDQRLNLLIASFTWSTTSAVQQWSWSAGIQVGVPQTASRTGAAYISRAASCFFTHASNSSGLTGEVVTAAINIAFKGIGEATVDSVNGMTGDVELGITDLDDFALAPAQSEELWTYSDSAGQAPSAGFITRYSYPDSWAMSVVTSQGNDLSTILYDQTGDMDCRVSVNGVQKVITRITNWTEQNSNRVNFNFADFAWAEDLAEGDEIGISAVPFGTGTTPLTIGDSLIWNGTNFRNFELQEVAITGNYEDLLNRPPNVVESVNGQETKDVSLALFDINNVGLASDPVQSTLTFNNLGDPVNLDTIFIGTAVDNNSPYFTGVGQFIVVHRTLADLVNAPLGTDIRFTWSDGSTQINKILVASFAATNSDYRVIKFEDPWSYLAGSAPISATLTTQNLGETPLVNGDILKYNSTTEEWNPAPSLPQRITEQITTESLTYQQTAVAEFVNLGTAGNFLTVQTNAACVVTFYTDEASRLADIARTYETPPVAGDGVLLEVRTTGAETILITPVNGYFVNSDPLVSQLPVKICSQSVIEGQFNISVKALVMET